MDQGAQQRAYPQERRDSYIAAPMPAAPPRPDTLAARLSDIAGVLGVCEKIVSDLAEKIHGPQPTGSGGVEKAGPAGAMGLAMEIGNRAQRLHDALGMLSTSLA